MSDDLARILADITAEADALCATLNNGADTLDQLTAKHLPTESRRALDPMTVATADLYDAGITALNRQPFQPEKVA